jgi:hypothetical protein
MPENSQAILNIHRVFREGKIVEINYQIHVVDNPLNSDCDEQSQITKVGITTPSVKFFLIFTSLVIILCFCCNFPH